MARLKAENGFTLAGNHYFASGYEFTAVTTLDGRRLDGQPTQRGIYINNGKKVVIK